MNSSEMARKKRNLANIKILREDTEWTEPVDIKIKDNLGDLPIY